MHVKDIEKLKKNVICTKCVGDEYLRAQIKKDGVRRVCTYCGFKRPSYRLAELSDVIEVAFESHYERTAQDADSFEQMMLKDKEISYEWYRKGEQTADAILYAAQLPEEAASDIQQILEDRYADFDSAAMGEETEFAAEAHYREKQPGDREWQEGWDEFEKGIKSEARFFSRTATQQLGALFDDVDRLLTRDGKPLIVAAGPGTDLTHLHRARVFQSSSLLESALMRPDLELAAPPSRKASAGRMNAKGISTFYGATASGIALAEVRPPVGSEVALARFEIIRPLRLLDLNAMKEVFSQGSIFDPQHASELGRTMFLRSLCDRVARPVMPDDQDFEYLPTQAIADYLATEGKVPLDGILFPSVQAGGKGLNAVLFHKASRCEVLELPKGTRLEARTAQLYAEGWEREYGVVERVPTSPRPTPVRKPRHPLEPFESFEPGEFLVLPYSEADADWRDVTLRIDLDSVEVQVVDAVQVIASGHRVSRYRITDEGDAF